METHEPHEDYLVEEFRGLARTRWGGKRPGAGAKPRRQLVNIDRAAKLLAITDNPYLRLAFQGLPTIELMRICAWHLMEGCDYKSGGRLLKHMLDFEEQAAERRRKAIADGEEPEPEPAPRPDPTEEYELDVEAKPVRPAPVHEEDIYLRSLSDREIARQLTVRARAAIADDSS